MRYQAGFKFRTVLQVDGRNVPFAADQKGDTFELSDGEFAAIERDIPGAAIPIKPKKTAAKPAKAPAERTRQVADAPTRGKKKRGKG